MSNKRHSESPVWHHSQPPVQALRPPHAFQPARLCDAGRPQAAEKAARPHPEPLAAPGESWPVRS